MPYHPPLTLTPLLIDLVSRISEQLGRWAAVEGEISPRRRRENRIRSIQASLAIEKRIELSIRSPPETVALAPSKTPAANSIARAISSCAASAAFAGTKSAG